MDVSVGNREVSTGGSFKPYEMLFGEYDRSFPPFHLIAHLSAFIVVKNLGSGWNHRGRYGRGDT